MIEILIEIIGYAGFLLIIATYYLNINHKILATSPVYVWGNLIGGLFLISNTYYHKAYPSMVLNVVWVVIAVSSLIKTEMKKQ